MNFDNNNLIISTLKDLFLNIVFLVFIWTLINSVSHVITYINEIEHSLAASIIFIKKE